MNRIRPGVIVRGLAAGAAGTAAMTVHQELRQRLAQRESPQQDDSGGQPGDPWESAPAPARVGKRLIEGVLGKGVPTTAIPALATVMHWTYGTSWGVLYAVGRGARWSRPRGVSARTLGPFFGIGVWAAAYAQLVPMGIYEPPWRYPLGSILDELGYHLTYGSTVAVANEILRRG